MGSVQVGFPNLRSSKEHRIGSALCCSLLFCQGFFSVASLPTLSMMK